MRTKRERVIPLPLLLAGVDPIRVEGMHGYGQLSLPHTDFDRSLSFTLSLDAGGRVRARVGLGSVAALARFGQRNFRVSSYSQQLLLGVEAVFATE